MQIPTVVKKVLGYLAPAKTFKESPKGTLDKVSRDFIKFLETNPWRRAKVAADVFEKAGEKISEKGEYATLTIPLGSNITILKHEHLPETVYPQICVKGVLKNKSLTVLNNVDIMPHGKVIDLPQANTIKNDGVLKGLGKAKDVVNWGTLRAKYIEKLRNYTGATGYVKEVNDLLTNDGKLFADKVVKGTNNGKLFLQEGGVIDDFGGDISAQKVEKLVKHPDADGFYKGTYQIGSVGETQIVKAPEHIVIN